MDPVRVLSDLVHLMSGPVVVAGVPGGLQDEE